MIHVLNFNDDLTISSPKTAHNSTWAKKLYIFSDHYLLKDVLPSKYKRIIIKYVSIVIKKYYGSRYFWQFFHLLFIRVIYSIPLFRLSDKATKSLILTHKINLKWLGQHGRLKCLLLVACQTFYLWKLATFYLQKSRLIQRG